MSNKSDSIETFLSKQNISDEFKEEIKRRWNIIKDVETKEKKITVIIRRNGNLKIATDNNKNDEKLKKSLKNCEILNDLKNLSLEYFEPKNAIEPHKQYDLDSISFLPNVTPSEIVYVQSALSILKNEALKDDYVQSVINKLDNIINDKKRKAPDRKQAKKMKDGMLKDINVESRGKKKIVDDKQAVRRDYDILIAELKNSYKKNTLTVDEIKNALKKIGLNASEYEEEIKSWPRYKFFQQCYTVLAKKYGVKENSIKDLLRTANNERKVFAQVEKHSHNWAQFEIDRMLEHARKNQSFASRYNITAN